MGTISLRRIRALDNLQGSALDIQLETLIAYIAVAYPWQIYILGMTLEHYHGRHRSSLRENIYLRKKIFPYQVYEESIRIQIARIRDVGQKNERSVKENQTKKSQSKESQSKESQSQKSQSKKNSCKESIIKFLNKIQLWQWLGFVCRQDKKEQLAKNQQQSQPTKNHQQSINLEKEVQDRSAEKDTKGTQNQEQASVNVSQQEDWQPLLTGQTDSEDSSNKKDLRANSEKSEKDQKDENLNQKQSDLNKLYLMILQIIVSVLERGQLEILKDASE